MFKANLRKKGLYLEEIFPEQVEEVMGDPNHLSQVTARYDIM